MDYQRLYDLICEIPAGRVATYGQLARLVGCAPRQVGYALRGLDPRQARQVPWHRVINAQGRISLREGGGATLQARRLKREGVPVLPSGRIELRSYGWAGPFDPDAWRYGRAARPIGQS